MQARSLWQPWATAVVKGIKRNETRSRATQFRGTFAVHATKSFPADVRVKLLQWPFIEYKQELNKLPSGVIVGTVDLIDCLPVDAWKALQYRKRVEMDYVERVKHSREQQIEEAFGDYSKGRYIWILANPVEFAEPIPAKGAQGWFKTENQGIVL